MKAGEGEGAAHNPTVSVVENKKKEEEPVEKR